MILNKKGLAVLPLVALLFTSCAKRISYKEACEFVDKNYTSTEEKTPTKTVGEFSGWGADDISKTYVKLNALMFGFELDDNLHGKLDVPSEYLEPEVPIKSSDLSDSKPELGLEFIYTVKGKNLTMEMKITIDQTEPSELHSFTNSKTMVNDQGYSTRLEFKQTIKGSVDDPTTEEMKTIVVDCNYNYYFDITY